MAASSFESVLGFFSPPSALDIAWERECRSIQNHRGDFLELNYWRRDLSVLQRVQTLAAALETNRRLESVSICLTNTGISCEGLERLLPAILNHPRISSLTLSLNECRISGSTLTRIVGSLSENLALNSLSLDLSFNPLNDEGAVAIFRLLGRCMRLGQVSLNLSSTRIQRAGMSTLVEWISNSRTRLEALVLKLEDNAIGGASGKQLADILETTSLQTLALDLRGNELGSLGTNAFLHLMSVLALKTMVLRLQKNHIPASTSSVLCEELAQCGFQSLTLDISENPEILGRPVEDIAETFGVQMLNCAANVYVGGPQQSLIDAAMQRRASGVFTKRAR
mmetsp:Transcript_34853/g.87679  ORF Transcript_34853/g.87679 Transcript_34853/m.87679 type:complete len:338 (-) Transcript_34853:419-1432(-)